MIDRISIRNSSDEEQLIRRRVIWIAVVVILLVILLLSRIFYIQIVENEHYTTLSQHNRVKVLPIPPIRGLIYSRDGVLLADNYPSFSLELIPERTVDVDETIFKLGNLVTISDEDIRRFRKQLGKKRRFDSIPLKVNLNQKEVSVLSVNRHRFPGVDIVARLNRYYPHGEETVHVIGYVGRIDEQDLSRLDESEYSGTTHIGKLGIEKSYEDVLHGKVGYQQVEVNAQGRVIRVLDKVPPVAGKNVNLTLDFSLQQAAVDALEGRKGAIVAIQPDDGAVLAMVSSPGYDPNLFVNGIDSASYQSLLKSPDIPLLNRATLGKYPPGSTIKPFLGLAALEMDVRHMHDKTWCPGWYSLKGSSHRYRDWKKQGHGHADLNYAIMQSCDVYFYSLAHDMGIDRIHEALAEFGFGATTGIDIGAESGGLNPSRDWKRGATGQPWYPGETLISGIGQGYILTTPLQLASATAVLANHGKRIIPHLASEYHDPITGASTRVNTGDNGYTKFRNSKYWNEIVTAMVDVVHGERGTARRSGHGAAYRFAGKTGTAQVIGIAQDEEYEEEEISEEFKDHAWFIAFAPVENPQIALAILVENGGGGSRTAAPIARALFDHYLTGGDSS